MKKFLPAIFFLMFSCISMGQQSIVSGIVIDNQTFQPIEGATVIVAKTNIAAITDALGNFTLKGNFTHANNIVVSSIGYTEQLFSVADIEKKNIVSISQKQVLLTDDMKQQRKKEIDDKEKAAKELQKKR